jgi:D-3-phosphoglycerate dehydrogenase
VISRCGAGLDNVDLKSADELKIKVYNTPDAPTDAVAELTVGLMLDCLRLISKTDRNIRKGIWEKPMGSLLRSKNTGIIGFGRIGRALSKILQAFGSNVFAYDIAAVAGSQGVQIVPFEELIRKSDIISLHIPASSEKKYIIDAPVISMMKEGAYLFNVARGGLVDEDALFQALRSGKIAGAGIDTFESEPYSGKLMEMENVVLTSHIGSYARDSRILMEKQAVLNLLKGLGG